MRVHTASDTGESAEQLCRIKQLLTTSGLVEHNRLVRLESGKHREVRSRPLDHLSWLRSSMSEDLVDRLAVHETVTQGVRQQKHHRVHVVGTFQRCEVLHQLFRDSVYTFAMLHSEVYVLAAQGPRRIAQLLIESLVALERHKY